MLHGAPDPGHLSPKNLRYALLKNPERLSENQQAQLQFLTKANPTLYRAYLLKDAPQGVGAVFLHTGGNPPGSIL